MGDNVTSPPVSPEARCERCDEIGCPYPRALAATAGIPGHMQERSAEDEEKWGELGRAILECKEKPLSYWRARSIAAEADRDAKQRGYDDLHAMTDPLVGRRDVWSQVDEIIKRSIADRQRADAAEALLAESQREHGDDQSILAAICRLVGASSGTGGQTVEACWHRERLDAVRKVERMVKTRGAMEADRDRVVIEAEIRGMKRGAAIMDGWSTREGIDNAEKQLAEEIEDLRSSLRAGVGE